MQNEGESEPGILYRAVGHRRWYPSDHLAPTTVMMNFVVMRRLEKVV